MAQLAQALLICCASCLAQMCVTTTNNVACKENATCGNFFGCMNCMICLVALFFMFK